MFEIEIMREKISRDRLAAMAQNNYGDMVKVVVDLVRKIVAAGGEMHADAEQKLLEDGSAQADLWGANIYPDGDGEGFIEYQSLINIRPKAGNRGMEIQDEAIRAQIKDIIYSLVG